MKISVLSSTVVASLVIGASMSANAAPPSPYNWTGFYFGTNVGGGWANSDRTSSANTWPNSVLLNATAPATLRGSSAVGGLQAGYNWQRGAVVVGIESDINASSFRASHDTGILPPPPRSDLGTYRFAYSVRQDWLATIRGRIGWSIQNWLLYATGGAALTNISQTGHAEFISSCGGGPACTTDASSSTTKAGWVAGAGFEYKLNRQWSVRAEYLHIDFGPTSADLPTLTILPDRGFAQTINLKQDVVRVGANYKFDWGAAHRTFAIPTTR